MTIVACDRPPLVNRYSQDGVQRRDVDQPATDAREVSDKAAAKASGLIRTLHNYTAREDKRQFGDSGSNHKTSKVFSL